MIPKVYAQNEDFYWIAMFSLRKETGELGDYQELSLSMINQCKRILITSSI